MVRLSELIVLDPTRSNPAVGISYGQTEFGKLLVIGESHYGGEDWAHPRATHTRIEAVLEGENATYFTKIAHLFESEAREFFPCIAFYNFKSKPMDIPGQSISREGFKDEVDQRFLFNVIDELRPDRIVVTSERLWSVLPNRHPDAPEGTFRVSDDSTDLFVPFTPELESELEKRRTKECFWYRRADGGFCLVGAVSHPRSSKFRREKSTAWIKSFLSIKKLP